MLKTGYKELQVWQKAMQLVNGIYEVTRGFPSDERFGLTSQLRRSAISLPSNIAEGSSRTSTKEFIRFIDIALGSLAEVETQILIAEAQTFLKQNESNKLQEQTAEIGRMLNGLQRSLENKLTADRRSLETTE